MCVGITSRLEYLKELGVDATWLAPIFKSPMNDFGYDVSDYYTIQPEYGSMEDFEQLLKKAADLSESYYYSLLNPSSKFMHYLPTTELSKFLWRISVNRVDRLFELF